LETLTISSIIRNSIEKYHGNTALSYVAEQGMTYAELGNSVNKVSALLRQAGIKHGDRLAILGENMPNWGIAYLSTVFIGAVVVPVLPDFHENEVETILNHSETKLIFASDKQVSRLKGLFSRTSVNVVRLDNMDFEKLVKNRDDKALREEVHTGESMEPGEGDLASRI